MKKIRVRVIDPNSASWKEGYNDYVVEAISVQAAIFYLRAIFPYAIEIISLGVCEYAHGSPAEAYAVDSGDPQRPLCRPRSAC